MIKKQHITLAGTIKSLHNVTRSQEFRKASKFRYSKILTGSEKGEYERSECESFSEFQNSHLNQPH